MSEMVKFIPLQDPAHFLVAEIRLLTYLTSEKEL